jgi:hypothetical protein
MNARTPAEQRTSPPPWLVPAGIGFEPAPVLSPGEATISSEGAVSTYTIAVTCSDFWAGVETTSHVLVDDATGAVWVANIYAFEEGGSRGLQAVDMAAAIASDLHGQDLSILAPKYSGEIEEGAAGVARTTAELQSGDGPPAVDIEIAEPLAPSDCATGSLSTTSPFPSGTQVEWVSADEAPGTRFNVLAQCGGELLLSGGALLVSFYPEDDNTMIASLSNTYLLTGDEVGWSNFVTPEPEETFFEQGGGGDILAAINVFLDGNRSTEPGYLQWTERPLRSSVGAAGLLDDVCPGP